MTPMLKQYYSLKEECRDAILFFRMGDFYEIFGEDAQEVAPRLELVLTSREKGDNERLPFCGVPHHSARGYWLKLLAMGYKVAIADQIEDPKLAKGLVKRAVTRVFTPGCIEDLEGLEADRPNFMLAVFEVPTKGRSALVGQQMWAVALSDISTGELRLGNVEEERDIISIVERHGPREILIRKFDDADMRKRLEPFIRGRNIAFSHLPEGILRDEVAQAELLHEILGAGKIEAQPCGKVAGGKAIVGALLEHLKGLHAPIKSFLTIRALQDPNTLQLGETAIRDLEIFETSRRREVKGSLFAEINFCRTAAGSRRLRRELCYPLFERGIIENRRKWVAEFLDWKTEERREFGETLTGFPDLQRLATRIYSRQIQPHELANIRLAASRAQVLAVQLEERTSGGKGSALPGIEQKIGGLRAASKITAILQQAIVETPGVSGSGSGVFACGFDHELDECTRAARGGANLVTEYEGRLRERTGISSLKIRPHQTFGLLIEVTKSNAGKVPTDFVRRQTMVNGERFITPELTALDETLQNAQAKAVERETFLYGRLLDELGNWCPLMRDVAEICAEIDMLFALALCAYEGAWCRPKITDRELSLSGSRHPVVERFVGRHDFVPNDVTLNDGKPQMLLTGPNMGGKSTVMRQVAVAAILNQIGSYVPARTASMPLFDRIFTRVGAGDDLASGQSTFMVEMSEAAAILRQATARSLIILDEVGRGTSTSDGLAIAAGILQEIAEKMKSFTLFATHYHELVEVASKLKTVRLGMMEAVEKAGAISFTHRLLDGAAASSFGLEVARLAGIPESVLVRARRCLDEGAGTAKEGAAGNLQRRGGTGHGPTADAEQVRPLEAAGLKQKAATPKSNRVLEKLLAVRIHSTTPLQALNILDELRAIATTQEQQSLFQ